MQVLPHKGNRPFSTHRVSGGIFFTSPQNQLHVPLVLGVWLGPQAFTYESHNSSPTPTPAKGLEQGSNASSLKISLQQGT